MNIGHNQIDREGRTFDVDIREYAIPTFFGDQTSYSVYINDELVILSPDKDKLDELIEDYIMSKIRTK